MISRFWRFIGVVNLMQRISILLFLSGLFIALPGSVHAAELFFEPVPEHEGPGFTVQLMLSYDRPVNAVEGVVRFDSEMLSIDSIIESPAGEPLWISPPNVQEDGSLSFAGIFPGGIEPIIADRIPLLTLTWRAHRVGQTDISIDGARVFVHGPDAQEDIVSATTLTVILDAGDLGEVLVPEDTIAPDAFRVQITSGTSLGQDGTYAVFSTRDHQTGVAQYELRERILGVLGRYRSAGGITKLSALWRFSIIEVRATDRAGNSVVGRHYPSILIATYVLLGLLIGLRLRRWRRP